MSDFTGSISDERFSERTRRAAAKIYNRLKRADWVKSVMLSFQSDVEPAWQEKIVVTTKDCPVPHDLLTDCDGVPISYVGITPSK